MGSLATAEKWEKAREVDRDLVMRARQGDQDAFREIVQTYQRKVYAVAMRMTRRHQVADDIAQDTFIRAYRNLDRFELGRPLAPWLAKIAVNLSINFLNSAQRREQALYTEDSPDGPQAPEKGDSQDRASDPLQELMSLEFSDALEHAVGSLSAEHRAVLLLKVVEGMRYDDIAETLGISRGTVMSRLFRARAKLKEKLQGHL